jgi:hypothetical protein
MPPKTEAQKKRMVASAALKKYKNFSAIQLSRELKRLQDLEKKQTTPANVIRIRVVKKLASKVSDKEISATEARKELKKKVPEKKQVTKKEFEKARKDLKDKKVSKPAPKRQGRTYQYTVYLPEDYSDADALDYWEDSKLVTKTSGVDIGKELTAEGGRPIFDKGTYHVFKAKKLHTIAEWKEATKGAPKGFVSDTGKNFGYSGGIVKKAKK